MTLFASARLLRPRLPARPIGVGLQGMNLGGGVWGSGHKHSAHGKPGLIDVRVPRMALRPSSDEDGREAAWGVAGVPCPTFPLCVLNAGG